MHFFKKFQSMIFMFFLNFVGEINLMVSRSVVLKMIFFAFLQPMRQPSVRMYQIVNNNNDVTLPTTTN